MKKIIRISLNSFICLFVCLFIGLFFAPTAWAQSCDPSCGNADECRAKIAKCQEAWNQMEVAKKPHADALRKMEADITAFQGRIKIIEEAAAIIKGEEELGGLLGLAGSRIRQFYKRSKLNSGFTTFFSTTNIGEFLRTLAYNQAVTNEDKKEITHTALSVKDIENRKKALENERTTLAFLKEETDKRAVSVRKLVGEATAYQTKLTGIIGSLTAKQQSFIAEKLSNLNLEHSDGRRQVKIIRTYCAHTLTTFRLKRKTRT